MLIPDIFECHFSAKKCHLPADWFASLDQLACVFHAVERCIQLSWNDPANNHHLNKLTSTGREVCPFQPRDSSELRHLMGLKTSGFFYSFFCTNLQPGRMRPARQLQQERLLQGRHSCERKSPEILSVLVRMSGQIAPITSQLPYSRLCLERLIHLRSGKSKSPARPKPGFTLGVRPAVGAIRGTAGWVISFNDST